MRIGSIKVRDPETAYSSGEDAQRQGPAAGVSGEQGAAARTQPRPPRSKGLCKDAPFISPKREKKRGRGVLAERGRQRQVARSWLQLPLGSLEWGWLCVRGQPRPVEPLGALLPSKSPRH